MFVQSNTIRAVKEYFKERLSPILTDSEIKQILNHALKVRMNLSASDLLLANDERLSESDLLYFRSIVKRLQNNEPIQYIFGDTIFADLLIKCDHRALIPRPETEELTEWILSDEIKSDASQILDLCTGSGCIALALKNGLPDAKVSAVDFSNDALSLAKENSTNLNLEVAFSQLDVLTNPETWSFQPESFDVWVSNPPYIPEQEKTSMHANVLEFEPEMALFVSNENPLVFYEAIAKAAAVYLKKGGKLYFELHENYADQTLKLVEEIGFIACEIKPDLQGKKRMLKAIRK